MNKKHELTFECDLCSHFFKFLQTFLPELTLEFGSVATPHFFIERVKMPPVQLIIWLIVSLFCIIDAGETFRVPSSKYLMKLSCYG